MWCLCRKRDSQFAPQRPSTRLTWVQQTKQLLVWAWPDWGGINRWTELNSEHQSIKDEDCSGSADFMPPLPGCGSGLQVSSLIRASPCGQKRRLLEAKIKNAEKQLAELKQATTGRYSCVLVCVVVTLSWKWCYVKLGLIRWSCGQDKTRIQ